MTKRTESEIREQIHKALDNMDEGSSIFPGLTYEDGVQASLDWVLGEQDEEPMEY